MRKTTTRAGLSLGPPRCEVFQSWLSRLSRCARLYFRLASSSWFHGLFWFLGCGLSRRGAPPASTPERVMPGGIPSASSLTLACALPRHPAQFVENLATPAEWPPFVEINLKRTPHRDPACYG